MPALTIRNKLLMFTLAVALGSLLLAGYLIDRQLLQYHRDAAQAEIREGFKRIKLATEEVSETLTIEAELLSSSEPLIASMDLIGRFQQPNNYQALVFDEEKRQLAQRLLSAVQTGRAHEAFLYGLDMEPYSFALNHPPLVLQGLQSYHNQQPHTLVQEINAAHWSSDQQQQEISLRYQQHQDLPLGISLFFSDNTLLMAYRNPIYRSISNQSQRLVGHLVLIFQLDRDFIDRQLMGFLDVKLYTEFDQLPQGQTPGNFYQAEGGFYGLQHFTQFAQTPFWVRLHYPESMYEESRSATRQSLLLAMLVTALLVLPLSLLLLRRIVTQPLSGLVQGVELLRQGHYQQPLKLSSHDELGQLAAATNRMAEEIRQREAGLTAANLDLQRLSEIMAHHFQEPTRRLMVFADRLNKKSEVLPDEDSRTSVAFIHQQAERLSLLVRDVQRYLAVEQNLAIPEQFSAQQVLDELLRSKTFAPRLQECGAQVSVPQSLPVLVFVRSRFVQLLSIFLDNAIIYRNAERPLQMLITVEAYEKGYRFRFADNGLGIAPEYREQVLQLFVRLVSVSSGIPGNGVGLALARRILQLSGGDLQVKESEMGGCEFVFEIPQDNFV
ncbi:MAG: HAMP domain-containing histidine kinase [Marinospirillum sp.]|uniref:sensor histidine kinase n=1 Tax=Marinospirillum sp. TaxID=2183934 RepID=UPI0019FF4EB8|nr:HAMP domain-containing sensor histidine kinase [Marinospirillum sp.]MBE0505479.1 HAMP domain-containing histidine kinase [Marinospirillum sp.]